MYQSMAQRMSAQPPFATTDTRLGTLGAPLAAGDGVRRRRRRRRSSRTTSAWTGTTRLGWLQMWNVDLAARPHAHGQRAASATRARAGRASTSSARPNRGANGRGHRRRPAVHLGVVRRPTRSCTPSRVRLRKRPVAGAAARRLSYTLSKSRDNASTLERRRRDGGAERQGPRGRVGRRRASTSATGCTADFNFELPFGREPAVAAARKAGPTMIFGGWMLDREPRAGVRLAVHGARHRRGRQRRPAASTARCARTTTASRSQLDDPTIAPVLQHGGVHRSRPRAPSATRRAT
ncbi:MAG: hypothetical protein MZV63_23815 [Marinilabiliales bacterium]|nr:hypothetical protein [Marinilabiliales bacterium]